MKNEKYSEGQSMLVVDYDAKNYSECYMNTIEDTDNCMKTNTPTWININRVSQSPILDEVGSYFGLSQLVRESLADLDGCTQFQVYPEYSYLSFFNLSFDLENLTLKKDRICSIIGKDILLTFQENSGSLFEPIRNQIKTNTGLVRKMQIDYLQCILLNTVIENIYAQHKEIDALISALENNENTSETDDFIYKLKKLLINSQEIILPLITAFESFNQASQFIEARVMNYYEEVRAKANRVKRKSKAQMECLNNIQLYRISQK